MKIVNFKKFEVSAATTAEAKEIISEHFNILGDATMAYKKAKEEAETWTDKDEQKFCLDYLDKKSKMTVGNGYIVVLEGAVADTRERPYRFVNVKNEGKRSQKKALQWFDVETGNPVSQPIFGTKTQAENEMKKLYKEGATYKKVECRIVPQVTNPVVCEAYYTPSKNTKKGHYLAFGVENC